MSEDRKAGQLILSQVGMFNEAVVLFENTIQPAVLAGIDACVESFAEDNGWDGEFEANEINCWLAPRTWITNPGAEEPEFKAKFEIDYIDSNDDYCTACFCGVATQGGQAGFVFSIDPGCFGGKTAWNACARKIPQDLIAQLTRLGFQNKDKGQFFLPITLDPQQLAQSWADSGEFTQDDDCFKPLYAALEKLKQAVPVFEQIMQNCASAAPGKSAAEA